MGLIAFIELIFAIVLATLYFSGAWVPSATAIGAALVFYIISSLIALIKTAVS